MDAAHEEHLKRILQNRAARKGRSGSEIVQPSPVNDHSVPHVEQLPLRQEIPPPPRIPPPQHQQAAADGSASWRPEMHQRRNPSEGGARPVDRVPATQFMDRVNNLFFNPHTADELPPDTDRGAAGPMMRSSSVTSEARAAELFQRGVFDNFRQRPVLVSSNIRPYQRTPSVTRSESTAQNSRSYAHRTTGGETQAPGAVPLPMPLTQDNPFRTQTFESYLAAPHNNGPPHQSKSAAPPIPMFAATEPALVSESEVPRQSVAQEPMFDLHESLALLQRGDWFMKWTRRQDRVHRRYFWLDTRRGVVYWSKSPGASVYFSSGLRLEEITSVDSDCIVEDSTNKIFYVLLVTTLERQYQLGTEQREKFDVWFDALHRLTESAREYNVRYHARYVQNGGAMYPQATQ